MNNNPYREKWRDRPDEASATSTMYKGAKSDRAILKDEGVSENLFRFERTSFISIRSPFLFWKQQERRVNMIELKNVSKTFGSLSTGVGEEILYL